MYLRPVRMSCWRTQAARNASRSVPSVTSADYRIPLFPNRALSGCWAEIGKPSRRGKSDEDRRARRPPGPNVKSCAADILDAPRQAYSSDGLEAMGHASRAPSARTCSGEAARAAPEIRSDGGSIGIRMRNCAQDSPTTIELEVSDPRLRGGGSVTPGWSTPEEVRELRHGCLVASEATMKSVNSFSFPRTIRSHRRSPISRIRHSGREVGSGHGIRVVRVVAAMVLLALVMIVSALYAAGWWVPRLWQPISDPGDWGQGLASLVVLGTSALGLAVAYLWFKIVTRAEETGPDSFQPVTSRLFPTELAWSLVDQGDDRAATILLKALLTTGGEPQQTRRALVRIES